MKRVLVSEVERLALRPVDLDVLDAAQVLLRAEMNFGCLRRRRGDDEDGDQATSVRPGALDDDMHQNLHPN